MTYVAAPAVRSATGDAWQGRYVGTVTIGDVQYFGDAILTADGLIRLYVGGPYDDSGVLPQIVPAASAQLVGTVQGQTSQISVMVLSLASNVQPHSPADSALRSGMPTLALQSYPLICRVRSP